MKMIRIHFHLLSDVPLGEDKRCSLLICLSLQKVKESKRNKLKEKIERKKETDGKKLGERRNWEKGRN